MSVESTHRRLNEDLEFFNEHGNIVVKDKIGRLVPFRFNLAQRYIHDRIEEQKRRTGGWVRALLLKGRQQGGSTYVEDRNFQAAVRIPGTSVLIISHESKTTDRLFDMVRRFYENMALSLRPTLGKDNPREMTFPGLGSDYGAITANNEQAGRGATAQRVHGSEVAFWKDAYAILIGALQAIALMAGTEIILESTSDGPKGLFYEMCMKAMRGVGDYILIFVPWFWQDEYEREPEPGFELTEEEEAYVRDNFAKPFPYQREAISRERALRKMAWRRAMVEQLSTGNNVESGRAKFRGSYPANPIEAFLSTGVGLVRPEAIVAARERWRKSQDTDEFAPYILGVDPAGDGKKSDRTILYFRRGRRCVKVVKYEKMRPMELAGIIARHIDNEGLDMVFIDRGHGEGTIDRLRELGYARRVIGVAFNERPLNSDTYVNKRAEILIEHAKWVNEGDVAIPDDDEVHADYAAMPLDKETSNGLKYMPSKEEIVKSFGRSYDIFDAGALTHAYPVRRGGAQGDAQVRRAEKADRREGPLSSMNRRRRMGRGS